MNKIETINSIKESLKKLFASEDKKFNMYVLTDGSKITCTSEELEIGSEVYAIDELGNQSPLDNGDYVLNDGRTITIVDNKVTTIAGETSTEEESPISPVEANVEMADGSPETPSGESDLAKRVSDLEAQLEEVLSLMKQMSDAQTKTTEEMMSKISKFSEEPGAEPVKSVKKGFEEYNSKSINAKKNMSEIEELRAILKEKRKTDNNSVI
jgi:hypothetical protein